MVTGAAGQHGLPVARHVATELKYELVNVMIRLQPIPENPVWRIKNSKRLV